MKQNEEYDRLIDEWKEKPYRKGIATCPCGKETSNRYIIQHRADCDVWRYYAALDVNDDQSTEEEEDIEKMPIMDLIEKRRSRFKELYGLHPLRIYVGIREKMKIEVYQETAGLKKEHEEIQPVLGMTVFYVPSEQSHLYMAG